MVPGVDPGAVPQELQQRAAVAIAVPGNSAAFAVSAPASAAACGACPRRRCCIGKLPCRGNRVSETSRVHWDAASH